ncbi:mitochondrial inner membrane protease subunit 2 [Phtheirospermum japonicum]|uniref:Mitochondrial inner membrane protease subunit 2 n=1 Tax=Phtheirospermum japonicum TaxID=374723 RepID=A0A830CF71_9LAMI|nr:mitochondrial inner membrane protease subunit 2 [Phtheirospermum japonicum]
MATQNFLWSLSKKCFTAGLVGLTISDRYAGFMAVRGSSMSPTLNPHNENSTGFAFDDYVLVEKLCLTKYKFSRGDVVVFRSPSNSKEKNVKRIAALPGDWVDLPSLDTVRVPEGHCWLVGDNASWSMDSRTLGPIPLGLICGRVTHVVWPPQRIGGVNSKIIISPEVQAHVSEERRY